MFSNKQIHVAALTAYASDAFEKRCMEAGMDTFFTKPVSDEKVKALIQKLKIIP
jgi:CheY-like chemotaxis protein